MFLKPQEHSLQTLKQGSISHQFAKLSAMVPRSAIGFERFRGWSAL